VIEPDHYFLQLARFGLYPLAAYGATHATRSLHPRKVHQRLLLRSAAGPEYFRRISFRLLRCRTSRSGLLGWQDPKPAARSEPGSSPMLRKTQFNGVGGLRTYVSFTRIRRSREFIVEFPGVGHLGKSRN
jgi:hypothetical protein